MVDRQHRGAVLSTAGALCALTGTFLPWLRSGTRNRSSYTIFDLVERLGFAPDGFVSWALRLWPVVPLLLVMTAITGWVVTLRRAGWPAQVVATVLVVVWVGGTAIAVMSAPDIALFSIGIGPAVTLLGLAAMIVGTFWLRPREPAEPSMP